jgi:hypothetical protein
MSAFVNHHRADKFNHHASILLVSDCPYLDDAYIRS